MYIALRDRPSLKRHREERGSINSEPRVREVSGGEVDLEGVPLPCSFLDAI